MLARLPRVGRAQGRQQRLHPLATLPVLGVDQDQPGQQPGDLLADGLTGARRHWHGRRVELGQDRLGRQAPDPMSPQELGHLRPGQPLGGGRGRGALQERPEPRLIGCRAERQGLGVIPQQLVAQPIPCMQCENAPCVQVCPVGATYHDASGVVLVDHNRCIGCRLCMAACPYDARVFNWVQPPTPPEAALVTYSPQFPVPHRKGTVSKCMLCAHRTANGELPACAAGCPMKAIYLGDLTTDVATNGDEVVKLSTFLSENHAYRYRGELRTRPRVYYIPGHGEAFGRRLGT